MKDLQMCINLYITSLIWKLNSEIGNVPLTIYVIRCNNIHFTILHLPCTILSIPHLWPLTTTQQSLMLVSRISTSIPTVFHHHLSTKYLNQHSTSIQPQLMDRATVVMFAAIRTTSNHWPLWRPVFNQFEPKPPFKLQQCHLSIGFLHHLSCFPKCTPHQPCWHCREPPWSPMTPTQLTSNQ